MNIKELKNYKPYSSEINRNTDYAEITFQNESIITVPRNSEQTIVKMLNDAFQNGVTVTLKNLVGPVGVSGNSGTSGPSGGVSNSGLTYKSDTTEKSINKTPVEDSQPINSYRKK